jgi:hypothetical protein
LRESALVVTMTEKMLRSGTCVLVGRELSFGEVQRIERGNGSLAAYSLGRALKQTRSIARSTWFYNHIYSQTQFVTR